MKKKAFTFVELLMVLCILGFIATLTLPLLRNLVNKDNIYRAYMKKAIADITDGYTMTEMQSRNFTASNCTINDVRNFSCTNAFTSCNNLRDVFATFVFQGENCAAETCNSTMGKHPGIRLGKAIILFEINGNAAAQFHNKPFKGSIYYDVNGDQGPNVYCRDRYKFIINDDGVLLDDSAAFCEECANLAIRY